MADRSTPSEPTMQASPSRPLLSALSRWWSSADTAPAAEPELGYESAHPWALGEDGAAERGGSTY